MMNKFVAASLFLLLFCFAAIAAEQAPRVGAGLPELSLPNLDGKITNLLDVAPQKPVILTFFTSWSKSCLDEWKNQYLK